MLVRDAFTAVQEVRLIPEAERNAQIPWDQLAQGAQGFDQILSPAVVKKFRSNFLTLMGNLKRIKTYDQALRWQEAVIRWREAMDQYIGRAIRQLKRFRTTEVPVNMTELWEHDIQRAVGKIRHELYSLPLTRYELADRYTYRPHDRKEVEQQLYRDFAKDAPAWDRRVRRKAQEAWRDLDFVLKSMEDSLSRRDLAVLVPQDETLKLQGFNVTLRGFDDRAIFPPQRIVEKLNQGLRLYEQRAKAVYPWLLRYRLPMVVNNDMGMDRGATYNPATKVIELNPTAFATKTANPRELVHLVAHEMGHHIYKEVLSAKDHEFWRLAIKGAQGPFDLREVAKKSKEAYWVLDEKLDREDPIFALRGMGVMDDPRHKNDHLETQDGIARYLAAGNDPIITLTTEPITGYAAKNPEEALCEALGMLVAYGPRAVLPVVRERLSMLLPQLRVTAKTTASLMNPGVDDAAIIVSQKYAGAYGKFLNKGGMGKLPPLATVINRVTKEWARTQRVGTPFNADELTREYIRFQAERMGGVRDREGFAMSVGLTTLTKQPYRGMVEQLIKTGRVTAMVTAAPGLRRVGEGFYGPEYRMDLGGDEFVHFLPRDRVDQVLAAGKLLQRPPYKKFGPDKVFAVSTRWGVYRPRVQTTHIKGEVAAILFRTPTKPLRGHPEEVIWDRDVVLKDPKAISLSKAVSLINAAPLRPDDEDYEVVYGAVTARTIPVDKAQAKRITDRLIAMLRAQLETLGPEETLGKWRSPAYTATIRGVTGNKHSFYCFLQAVPSGRSPIMGGGVGTTPSGKNALIVHVGGAIKAVGFRSLLSVGGTIEKRLYRTVLHEMTHAADRWEAIEHRGKDAPKPDASYYNDPRELRAFMQEVVEEVVEWLRNPRLGQKVIEKVGGKQAFRWALKNSDTWRTIEPELTPGNKQRVMKAAYQEAAPLLGPDTKAMAAAPVDPRVTMELSTDRLVALLPKIEAAAMRVRHILDRWGQTGEVNRQSLKLAVTAHRKAVEALGKLKAPQGLRPGEKLLWDDAHLTIKNLLVERVSKESPRYNKELAKYSAEKARDAWDVRIDGVVEDMRKRALPEFTRHRFLEPRFQFQGFDVIDAYGLNPRAVAPWFEVITKVKRVLEQKGLGYLCYGTLRLDHGGGKWAGLYQSSGDVVSLSVPHGGRGAGVDRMIGTLTHELGHRLWFKFLDGGARDKFSTPWIDREELVRKAWESYRHVFDFPAGEAEDAFQTAWNSRFDLGVFERWLDREPSRRLRWLQRLVYVYPNAQRTFVRDGSLDPKAFAAAHDRVVTLETRVKQAATEDERLDAQDSLDRYEKRQRRVWVEPPGGWAKISLTFDDIKRMLEPHGTSYQITTKNESADLLREALQIQPPDISVTDYGQTNRREDFAELFEEVVLGKVKDRQHALRLQAVLPKGRVVSQVTATTMDRAQAFKLFKQWVVKIWGGGPGDSQELREAKRKSLDNLVLKVSTGNPKGTVLASLSMMKGTRALGDTLVSVSPYYILNVSDRLLEKPKEFIDGIMGHEALHVGYPRHDSDFRALAKQHKLPLTESWADDPGFKVQRKEGARFKTIRVFDDEHEAMQWGKQQAREDRDHKYRIISMTTGWTSPEGQRYKVVEDLGDRVRVEITHEDNDLPAEQSWTFTKPQFERLKKTLPQNELRDNMTRNPVAAAPSMPFNVGDMVLYGKYKNKKGKILRFGTNPKGQVTVEIEPVPKGRKHTKEMGLFKIWTTPDAIEALVTANTECLTCGAPGPRVMCSACADAHESTVRAAFDVAESARRAQEAEAPESPGWRDL